MAASDDYIIIPCMANANITAESSSCPITAQMIQILDLTNFDNYFQAYCINPPSNDDCPYGVCPNPDIGGPLIRISAYLTTLLVAILIFYSHKPEDLKDSIWPQILTVYSLLIACGIAIIKTQLTRIHAIIAIATAGSPLSVYIVIYAIRSIWDENHRMKEVFGGKCRKTAIIARTLAIVGLCMWFALAIYTLLPNDVSHFTQISCEPYFDSIVLKYFFFLPIILFGDSFKELGVVAGLIYGLPIELAILSWIIAIWRCRAKIWTKDRTFKSVFLETWRQVRDRYPFIQFVSVVVLPLGYWVAIIEIGALNSNDDNQWSATFGQVLALFVTLPPLVEVARISPRCYYWFKDLTWVRFLTCRSHARKEDKLTTSMPRSIQDSRDNVAYLKEYSQDSAV